MPDILTVTPDSDGLCSQPCSDAHGPLTGHLVDLAARGQVRHYRSGVLLIQEGDLGDTIFIITRGRLRVYSVGQDTRELTLAVHGPGEYVGEMSLDGGPRSANVETLEPSTCAVISKDVLLNYIGQHPDFALELMSKLIRRARLATESARSIALVDVYGRLVQLLERLAGAQAEDGSRTLQEKLTHQQLANHLACSREMVSRLLKDLERGGYIRTQNRWLVLVKPLPARW